MRLFAELEPSTYEEIHELVNDGKYDSVEQFLRVAVQNQLAIERTQNGGRQLESSSSKGSGLGGTHWEYSPPDNIPTEPPFDKDRESILLFSQYYRFFPLKCALYHLALLTANNDGPVSINDAYDFISMEIEPIRDALVAWEEKNDIKKQNRKSTGLPKEDVKSPERSMRRYLNHYVGKTQPEKNEPAGFGHDLGYVSFKKRDVGWRIQLTPSGAQFVHLQNPLLGNGPEASLLSDEEQAFIVETIRNELSEEYRFMGYIYDVLSDAEGSYTNHLSQFREFLEESTTTPDEMSDNNVRSQVGGAISRLVELGILERGQRRGYYNTVTHPNEVESVTVPQR